MGFKVLLLVSLVGLGLAGDVTISYSPASLRFGKEGPIRSSSLDDIFAASLGYTAETTPWAGLTVTSPFDVPSAVVVLGIKASGSEILLEGDRYSLQEDESLEKVYSSLRRKVSAAAQRPTHFVHMEVADAASPTDPIVNATSLNRNTEPDAAFLQEIAVLPALLPKLKNESSVSHGGQDFVFFQIESFALVVKTYGDDSPQVREGKQLLRSATGRFVAGLRNIYNDKVLFVTVVVDKSTIASNRVTRSVKQTYQEAVMDLNLANEYSEDYPAIFNIILFLSIVLFVTILAVSVSMAYMDPGRDSIIYRMTNPRMKKDQ